MLNKPDSGRFFSIKVCVKICNQGLVEKFKSGFDWSGRLFPARSWSWLKFFKPGSWGRLKNSNQCLIEKFKSRSAEINPAGYPAIDLNIYKFYHQTLIEILPENLSSFIHLEHTVVSTSAFWIFIIRVWDTGVSCGFFLQNSSLTGSENRAEWSGKLLTAFFSLS